MQFYEMSGKKSGLDLGALFEVLELVDGHLALQDRLQTLVPLVRDIAHFPALLLCDADDSDVIEQLDVDVLGLLLRLFLLPGPFYPLRPFVPA
jgi:hypothetical protein